MGNSVYKDLVNKNNGNNGIKSSRTINFSDVIERVKDRISDTDFRALCAGISSGKVKIGMDVAAVKTLLANKENINVQRLFQEAKMPKIDIDINSLKELPLDDFNTIRNMGVDIGKVYVNSGWDKAAARGYTPNKYETIITNAEKMVNKAKSDLANKNPDKPFKKMSDRDKFMMIYNMVISDATYDYSAVKSKGESQYTSRNLEGFFCNNKCAVCAGFADALVQLGTMMGLEIEYVQGDSKSAKMNHKEYHAWVRVKIDSKWYNADPTWDANKVDGKYGFCLKSDADFKSTHKIDRRYNPTYRRNENGRLIGSSRSNGERYYEDSSSDSISNDELVDEYYTEDMDREPIRKFGEYLSDEDATVFRSRYVPNAPSSVGTMSGNSIVAIIINFLLRITSMPAKVANKLKDKFYSGKLKKDKLSDSKYIEEEANNAENAFDAYKVDSRQAGSYTRTESENSQKRTESERSDRE